MCTCVSGHVCATAVLLGIKTEGEVLSEFMSAFEAQGGGAKVCPFV